MDMTSKPRHAPRPGTAPRLLAPFAAFLATVLGLPAQAVVAIPETPMQTNNGVPPNLMFVLDDSGSMAWRYMYNPAIADLRNGTSVIATPTGDNRTRDSDYTSSNSTALAAAYDQSHTTNSIYYNPYATYRGWQRADGTYMGDTAYTAVFSSNTLASGTTISLASNTQVFYTPTTTATDLSDIRQYRRVTFLTDGTAQVCTWRVASGAFDTCSTVTSFTWGTVTRTLAAEKQNFANWYSYHRTRSKLAKAGASYAFNDPVLFSAANTGNYRVGFDTIHNRSPFLIPVETDEGRFRSTNRTTWFDRLFAATASDGTPLRNALDRTGKYFEDASATGPWGPQAPGSQYACRQNFTIMTTDGFWNGGGPTVGNVDGTDGPTITRDGGDSFTYAAKPPFSDEYENTLADVAMYYWKRDLRTDSGMVNIVPTSATNPAFWQHMVTFGISIGLRGSLDPETAVKEIINGTATWPNPMDAEDVQRIDDLLHATVNGRGRFVAASDPAEFVDGLGNALRAISERRASGSNAAISSTSTAGGSTLFSARYYSAKWYGELDAFPVSGTGISSSRIWRASIPTSGRRLFTYSGSVSTPGTTFPTTAQTTTLGAAIAAYVAGDRSNEESNGGTLRDRESLLGDIVNSSPTYLKTSDTVQTVFVGSNDGMMHAFNALNGVERFAYVPRGIDLLKLRNFANPDYAHHFFVDGPVTISDRRFTPGRDILVGTLGRGGKGLYALDVTNPATFGTANVLWDLDGTFNTDMGFILGRPFIATLNNGQTAVITPNGINSSSGRATLFLIDAFTGTLIKEIDTGVGSSTDDNGLAAPRGVDEDYNGTVDYVYAGDLKGNLWKFDLADTNESQWGIANNAPLYAPSTSPAPQPITGGVTTAVNPINYQRWVFFGTGRLLTIDDLTNTSLQSIYGIIDDGTTPNTRRRTNLTARDITQVSGDIGQYRSFSAPGTLPSTSKGWYIDLDQPPENKQIGERMVGDPQVLADALIFPTIIPNTADPCQQGRGYLNALDAFTGTSLSTALFDVNRDGNYSNDRIGTTAIGSVDLGIGMVTNPAALDKIIAACGSSGNCGDTPYRNPTDAGRISWREVVRR